MTKLYRIKEFLFGIGIILFGVAMMSVTHDGYALLIYILSLAMFIYGLKKIIFFILMARHMVGGMTSLYEGIIAIDLSAFTLSLSDISKIYILLYLVVIYAISGGIQILRALETKKAGAPGWKFKLMMGTGSILIAIACLAFIRSEDIVVWIYSFGLFYSGIIKILSAVKRTEIIYIQ